MWRVATHSSAIGSLLHGRDRSAAATTFDKDSTRPTDPPFNKDSRIAIIGGGPAGLTMAYQLQKRGYQKVLVLSSLPKRHADQHLLSLAPL